MVTLIWLIDSSKAQCIKLYCGGICIGLVKPSILPHLLLYNDVFKSEVMEGSVVSVKISDHLSSVKQRTDAVNGVFKDLRSKGTFSCLKGWRDEVCISYSYAYTW